MSLPSFAAGFIVGVVATVYHYWLNTGRFL